MNKDYILRGVSVSDYERTLDKAHAWFFAYPTESITLNELREQLKVSKSALRLAVKQLQKEGFLTIQPLGRLWNIHAHAQHTYFTTRKIPFNLKVVYESGIIEWITAHIPQHVAIILFGSYRKGDDIDKSDLDIAIEVTGEDPIRIDSVTVRKLGYRENIKANLLIFSRKKIDLNLFNNIANGIVVKGFLEVRP